MRGGIKIIIKWDENAAHTSWPSLHAGKLLDGTVEKRLSLWVGFFVMVDCILKWGWPY